VAAYAEQLQPRLLQMKITRAVSKSQETMTPEEITVGKNVSNYLKYIGIYGAERKATLE